MEQNELTLNEYQKRAMETCMPSCDNFSYMMLNLVGEVGELASKVAKAIRKEQVCIGMREHCNQMLYAVDVRDRDREEYLRELKLEAGDVAWQLAGLCSAMGWSFEEICQMNLEKLASRKERGVIDGDGDNR